MLGFQRSSVFRPPVIDALNALASPEGYYARFIARKLPFDTAKHFLI